MIRDVREVIGEVVTELDPGRPGTHAPKGTGLLFQANHASGLVKHPKLRVWVLGAVIGAGFVEPDLGGEGVVIEKPDGIDLTGEEARTACCV